MVVGGQVLGGADAEARERDELVLADDEHRAGFGCGVAEEPVERRRAESLELELPRQDAAEVVHGGLDRVALRERADQAVERVRRRAGLVVGVDRERASFRVAAAPVLGVDGGRQLRLDRCHRGGQVPEAPSDHESGQGEVHGPDRQSRSQGRREEDRRQHRRGRQAEEEAERREDEADRETEPGHPDRQVREHAAGEARHDDDSLGCGEGASPATLDGGGPGRHGAEVRWGPVRLADRQEVRRRRRQRGPPPPAGSAAAAARPQRRGTVPSCSVTIPPVSPCQVTSTRPASRMISAIRSGEG